MKIKQFEDKPLAHYSYAIVSGNDIALVDPARDPMPYYAFAEKNNARITAIFETHPHADFVSSHLQIHKETGATIYTSSLVGADYPHKAFDHGDSFTMGNVEFKALHTPGHSPDGITIVAHEGDDYAMFTGDTLFIGDVGRPDLREKAGNMKAKREELAKMMFNTIQTKFNDLPDETVVYPAHGAGSLCGKNLSDAASSTLGNERKGNWAFRTKTEDEFVSEILKDQPFIPAYFGFDVGINKGGADNFESSITGIPFYYNRLPEMNNTLIVDTRPEEVFKKGHFKGSINIQATNEDDKIETWLGSIVQPEEPFILVAPSAEQRDKVLRRIAKIGYEKQIKAVLALTDAEGMYSTAPMPLDKFKSSPEAFTIVDIRNPGEVSSTPIFENSLNIPLNELRDRYREIPEDKPLVVHCAGGYRSAAGSSILEELKDQTVYDLSEAVKEFK
ncbi:MBL fold metallo-hydrolase [Robertkochia marina]|uniref:MBL fold metallo-hydrolase n=1 Tax=Robertkochia marina TaxID=1227945 RepID=A0A4S3M0L6_9FLAO|nr:MBL fold metallo-hydrolase [Robertkochia marina]THD66473.1 MBL fold metallo-hydrolase [Robertkochia marina]TRZ44152.1 MBL fold metallo-hydrolase [Robertkochia marina]